MNSKFFEEVICFTKEFSGEEKVNYNENTDIEKNVGITGDDAWDYLVAFGKKFNVDVSKFDFDDHFDMEGAYFFGVEMTNINRNKKPITIGVLVDAIISGKIV
jgi:hypothetical protein